MIERYRVWIRKLEKRMKGFIFITLSPKDANLFSTVQSTEYLQSAIEKKIVGREGERENTDVFHALKKLMI